jgi:heptaprenyl diphosphate synthase
MNQTKKVTQYGLLIALALILSYVEAQLPVFFAVPGMKLGLTNVVVLFALYSMGERSAVTVNLLRIFLVSLLFGNGMSLAYSISGGLLSGLVMILLKKTGQFRMVTVSVAGGVAHNVGQILAAMALLRTTMVGWYLLVLWFTGIGSGLIIGILGGELCRRLNNLSFGGIHHGKT